VTATSASNSATMTIGQLARLTGLSVKTLRRLEGMGLIEVSAMLRAPDMRETGP
jgi:hypothetical protein